MPYPLGGQPDTVNKRGFIRGFVAWSILWLGVTIAACSPPASGPTTDRPSLTLLDSVALQETDSTFLADLGPYLAVDHKGDPVPRARRTPTFDRQDPVQSLPSAVRT